MHMNSWDAFNALEGLGVSPGAVLEDLSHYLEETEGFLTQTHKDCQMDSVGSAPEPNWTHLFLQCGPSDSVQSAVLQPIAWIPPLAQCLAWLFVLILGTSDCFKHLPS